MRRTSCWLMIVLAASAAHAQTTRPTTRPAPPKPTSHSIRRIEGWAIHVDDRLLAGADQEIGERALKLLGDHLGNVVRVVPAEKVERLRKVPIWLDRTHGELRSAQYHPSRAWLLMHGYDQALTSCVHIPDAAGFVAPALQREQPWMVLHELAHAYHDQVLGFDEPRIKAAWKKFVDSGKYKSVKHASGRMRPHYGLTDQKEFFAEMSEAYFGKNDFFPSDAAELKREELELFGLLQEIWGKPRGSE